MSMNTTRNFLLFAGLYGVAAFSLHAEPIDVYFGTGGGGSKGIFRAKFDPDRGRLGQATLAAEIGGPGFLAFNKEQTRLYAVCRTPSGKPGVAAYDVDAATGDLKFLDAGEIGDGGGTHVAVHPSGKFLLTAQYGGGSTALFPIKSDGKLGPVQVHDHKGGSKVVGNRQDSPHPHWCGFSPDGKYAFVPDLGMDVIVIYKIDLSDPDKPTIAPHSRAVSVPGGGPRHMRFSIDGKFIYLLNELALSVTTFAYDAAKGTAKAISTTPTLSDEVKAGETFNSASEILVHPNGKFVYSANRGNDSVTCYLADPGTGKLTVTEVESVRGAWPRNINLGPEGKYLFAAGAHSNTVAYFSIDQATGRLSFHQRSVINVPGPICILFRRK